MNRLLLLALCACAAPVAAQSVAFRPLAIGNTWTYAMQFAYTQTSACEVPAQRTGYSTATVLRDTTLSGAAARVLSCQEYDPNGALISSGTLAVPVAFSSVTYDAVTTACDVLNATRTPTDPSGGSQSISIGGTTYPMGALATYTYRGSASGFRALEMDFHYADRVGVYASRHYSRRMSSPPLVCAHTLATLVAARVDGVSYGNNPVAGEASPEPTAAPTLHAYPVPASQAVTIESAERAAVEVVDALGRRVASGEAEPGRPLRLDVSAWPAGVYVARSVSAGGTQTSRIIVAR